MRTIKLKSALVAALVAGVAAVLAVSAANAFAAPANHRHARPGRHHARPSAHRKHGSVLLMNASLAPAHTTDPMLHGVAPGAKPWMLQRGSVTFTSRGALDLRVQGLLIPGLGTGPVKTISASLYCGADTAKAAVSTTPQVALSGKGDAMIHDMAFKVPSACLAPMIMVHPNGQMTSYIAASGWRS
jgi:hypothetical protein